MKVAMTDMDIVWEDKEKNKSLCAAMVKEAAVYGADLILFPEMTLTGFSNDVPKIADKEQETVRFFVELAEERKIAIGFGYVSMPDKKGRNHFALIDSKGSLRMDYVKLHPFTHGGEADFYEGGNEFGCFTMLEQWNCAGFVCYDLRFPESFQKLPDRDVIFLIANWPESRIHQWYALLQARAIEMQSYVVGINRTGTGNGICYPKSSVAYSPKGKELIAETGEMNRYVELNRDARRRYAEVFPVRKDRRKGFDYE